MVGLEMIVRSLHRAPRRIATIMAQPPMPTTEMAARALVPRRGRETIVKHHLRATMRLIATAMAQQKMMMLLMAVCVLALTNGVGRIVPFHQLAAVKTIAMVMPFFLETQWMDVYAAVPTDGLVMTARPRRQMAILHTSNAVELMILRLKKGVMNGGPHFLQQSEQWPP